MLQNHHRYCLQQLQFTEDVPGDVIECGIGRGDNSLNMAAWIRDLCWEKMVYACDTFEGLPYTDEETSHIKSDLKKGECIHRTLPEFCKQIKKYKLDEYLWPIPGLIEETLPLKFAVNELSFVWLDLDLYMPTKFAWEFLSLRVSPGGIIGIHDYTYHRCPGIEEIVDTIIMGDPGWVEIYGKGTSIFFKKVQE